MTRPTHTKEAIRAAMDHLIDRATQFDVDALEAIHHRDFHPTLVMPDSALATHDKEGSIAHFRKQAEEGRTRLNPWADWHDFHALGDSACCVLKLLCNIVWRFEDRRWRCSGGELLAVWHDLSDVRLAEALEDRALFGRFCQIARTEAAPERPAFASFRRELLRHGPD